MTEGDRVHEGNVLEGEDVELVRLSREDTWRMVDAGQIRDAKALVGLLAIKRDA